MKLVAFISTILCLSTSTVFAASVGVGSCNSVSGTFSMAKVSDLEQLQLIAKSESIAVLNAVKHCKAQSLNGDIDSAVCATASSTSTSYNGQPKNVYAWTIKFAYSSTCKVQCN